MKKRIVALLLGACIAVAALAGCGSSAPAAAPEEAAPAEETAGETAEEAAEPAEGAEDSGLYSAIDISEPVTIHMYVVGTEPADLDKVVAKINEKLNVVANATLDLQVISLSEYATKYPLVLTGGDPVDLIYSAPWMNYKENVSKKAFIELTDEFLQKYMPQTWANEPEEAFKQMKIDGKLYAVPRNQASYTSTYNVVLVRGDLMDKYGFEELTSFEDYEKYLLAVAENEKGIYAFYNMPTHKPAIYSFFELNNNLIQIVKGDYFIWQDDGSFDMDEVRYYFDSDEYRAYAQKMAAWAEAGVWPSDAISGTIQPVDYFTQGTGASMVIAAESVDATITTCKNNGIEDIRAYNIFPDKTTQKSAYSGDAIAIPYTSEHPERAAMVLDLIKNDRELCLLFDGGIEGEHYIYNEADNTRTDGPAAANYTWDAIGWAIRNDWEPTLPRSEKVIEIMAQNDENLIGDYWPCSGFSFDTTNVKTQKALLDSLINEYSVSFDLGVFGADTDAKLDEFIEKLNEAGLEDLKTEYLAQLGAYIGQ